MVYLFLADGFEEVEAITPFDYLKRSGFEVKTIGVEKEEICGSHGLKVLVDFVLEEFDLKIKEGDFLILPGGLKGTENLNNNEKVLDLLKKAFGVASIGAICAARSILGRLGFLKGLNACCYPGFEEYLVGAKISKDSVVVDKNIITSRGAGTAQEFSFEIIRYLKGKEESERIKQQVQWEN